MIIDIPRFNIADYLECRINVTGRHSATNAGITNTQRQAHEAMAESVITNNGSIRGISGIRHDVSDEDIAQANDFRSLSRRCVPFNSMPCHWNEHGIGHVYFLARERWYRKFDSGQWYTEDSIPIKIGYSSRSIASRIRDLETGSPERLICIYWFYGSRSDEACLHNAFKSNNIRNEWFSGELISHYLFMVMGHQRMETGAFFRPYFDGHRPHSNQTSIFK